MMRTLGCSQEGFTMKADRQDAPLVPAPAASRRDLRAMLREHLARRACEQIDQAAAVRDKALTAAATFDAWRANVREHVAAMLDLGDVTSQPLNVRQVSTHEQHGVVIENVIFESLAGWQVNGTVFRPRHDGPYPAIVVPVGHSAKTNLPYQLPCQVFARAGYLAITFDPPGQNGEKQPGNDHFADGVRCYAVGQSSNRYFIADAIRAMDYLDTRDDVQHDTGYAMTGVSGGGHTTMWAALVDDRVRVAAPVCCISPLASHPVRDAYAICPEQLPIGRLERGMDHLDLLCALAPRPVLYLAGLHDEVYEPNFTQQVIDTLERVYAAVGSPDRFEHFVSDCGHDYTVAMARIFVDFVDRHLLLQTRVARDALFDQDPPTLPPEAMRCEPAAEPNMRTITANVAESLRHRRPRLTGRADAARAVRQVVRGLDEVATPHVVRGSRARSWCSDVEELLFEHERDIAMPATALWPRKPAPWPVLMMYDDRGRWASMRRSGWLARASRHLDREHDAPAILSVDLRGWGDTTPADTPYDLASWSGLDRWPSYISASLNDGLLAQRVRDAVVCTQWMLQQEHVDAKRIVFAGHGLGAVVALMAAAMVEQSAGVVCVDAPASIEDILRAERYAWPQDVFVPGILAHLDVQPLAEAVGPVLSIRPRDAMMQPLRDEDDGGIPAWVWGRLGIASD